MVWIVASHLFFYAPGSIKNLQMILTYAENWYLRPLFATALCVDTYFVIRLVKYSFLICAMERKILMRKIGNLACRFKSNNLIKFHPQRSRVILFVLSNQQKTEAAGCRS
jgi:hypothetical protein